MIGRIASFSRLIDEKGNLSLTNAAVFATVGNLAQSGTASTNDVVAFVIAMIGYAFKKWVQLKEPEKAPSELATEIEKLKEALEETKNKVSGLAVSAGIKPSISRRP